MNEQGTNSSAEATIYGPKSSLLDELYQRKNLNVQYLALVSLYAVGKHQLKK